VSDNAPPAGATFPLTSDAAQVRRLRAMKRLATAVLLSAAVVFVASSLAPDSTAMGFVRAAAEAAMVGGLADWFAITALFRRPLGLPIPHTALIPTRKDALAEQLGEFVTTTFLTRENVGGRLAEADVVTRVAQWAADPDNARRLSVEVAAAAEALAASLDPDDVAEVLLVTARTDAARRAYAPLLGRLLQTTVDDDAHQSMTDVVLTSAHKWLVDNRREVVLQLKARFEDGGTFLWLFTTTGRVDRVVGSVIAYLAAAAHDRDHDLRELIDRLLRVLAVDLQDDTPIAAQLNVEAMRVIEDPALRAWLVDVLSGARASLQQTLADPDGPAVRRLTTTLTSYADRVCAEPELHDRFDRMLTRLTFHVIDRYSHEFTDLVEATVGRWDGKETARRIELLAGRDLQYIRINGSVVGGLAGVAIHAVGLALGS
jgi:uncharacterized membrane-anchored protein YjiN (DUF445 family)